MLKLSRAMVGHVEAICQMSFGHVVRFVSQSALPQKQSDFKWFWRAMFYPFGGQMQGWAQIQVKFGHLGPC